MSVLLVAAFVALAFWVKYKLLYYLAGFSCLAYGFTIWADNPAGSILIVVLGMFMFVAGK